MSRWRRRDERGASAIELAIVAPVLIFVIFATIQFALWFYGRNVALQAAREGVSSARLVDVDDPAVDSEAALRQIEHRVEHYARRVGQEALLDPTATAEYDGTQRVRVTVRGRAVQLVPGISLTITRTISGEIERFERDEPDGG